MALELMCEICGKTSWKDRSEKLIECSDCGLVRANFEISSESAAELYVEDYFTGGEYANYVHDRVSLEKNFKERINKLEKFIKLDKNTFVVEVGCAYGFFLNLIKQKIKKHAGFDVSEEAVAFAGTLGVNATTQNFLDCAVSGADVVCMWDVVEHLPNPGSFIAKSNAVLKKGGYLALTTGDMGSLVARLRGDKWRMVHPPTHLFYFSSKTITKLLEKNGFEVVKVGHQTVYRNFGSAVDQIVKMGERKNGSISKFWKFVQKVAALVHLNNWNFGINLFDIMEVVAVKKNEI